MTGRSDSEKVDPDRGNNTGRLLFAAVLVFAVLATLTLVFTDSTKWLKLAVIAALWAAFFGAMLGVKYRHQAADRESEVADLQAVYELELEREVAARREYELEVEAETRRRVAEDSRDAAREDIAALRAELRALRENLDRLTGGEVLVERIALRAQSTRMRTIGSPNANARAIAAEEDIRRSITAGPAQPMVQPRAQQAGRITGRSVGAVLDPSTELMEPAPPPRRQETPQRVEAAQRVEVAQRIDSPQATQYRPTPGRSQTNRSGAMVVTTDGPGDQPNQVLRTPPGSDQRDSSARVDRSDRPASRSDRDEDRAPRFDRTDAAQRPAAPRRDPAEDRPSQQRGQETGRVPTPSTGEQSRTNVRRESAGPPPVRPPAGPISNPMAARSAGNSDPASAPTRYAAPVSRPASPNSGAGASSKVGAAPPTGSQAASGSPNSRSSQRPDGGAVRAAGDGPVHRPPTDQPSRHSSPVDPPAVPAQLRADNPPSGTRQGGRRRAEEPADWTREPENWADDPDWQPEDSRRGRHGGAQYDNGQYDSGSYEPVAARSSAPASYAGPAGSRSGARRAEPESAGAHTAGRSVTELLAAHRPVEDSPRRHRRRAE